MIQNISLTSKIEKPNLYVFLSLREQVSFCRPVQVRITLETLNDEDI